MFCMRKQDVRGCCVLNVERKCEPYNRHAQPRMRIVPCGCCLLALSRMLLQCLGWAFSIVFTWRTMSRVLSNAEAARLIFSDEPPSKGTREPASTQASARNWGSAQSKTRLRLEVFFGVVLGSWKCGALSSSRSLISKLLFRIRTPAQACACFTTPGA